MWHSLYTVFVQNPRNTFKTLFTKIDLFPRVFGTGAKAPVPKNWLKVFQNRFLMQFCNILKYLIGKLKNLHSNGCIVEML